MCTEIEKYRKEIRGYLADDSEAIFGNYTKEHAACVTELFIESAQKNIDILSGCFPCDFYFEKGFANLLQDAASRGVKIRVVTLCDSESRDLRNMGNQIQYRAGRISQGTISHFMVVDNKRYRLEAPHVANPQYVKAEVCCNGVRKANALENYFNDIWDLLAPEDANA